MSVPYCWITNRGTVIPVKYGTHSDFIYKAGLIYSEVEVHGWVHVSDEVYCVREPNLAQQKALGEQQVIIQSGIKHRHVPAVAEWERWYDQQQQQVSAA